MSHFKRLFYAIEINTLLWIALVVLGDLPEKTQWWAVAGFIIAALLQRWAYYDLYKQNQLKADAK